MLQFLKSKSLTALRNPNQILSPLAVPLGVKGVALAKRDDIVVGALVLASAVGVKDGESTLRLFFGLYKLEMLANYSRN